MAIGDAWAENSWIDASWASGAWSISITGIVSYNEQNDTLVATGHVTITGSVSVAEISDTLAASGYILQPVTGTLGVTENPDIAVISGIVPVKFIMDIQDLNLTIPKADEDPAEQQRVLIENLTLIQQALRNLGQ
ncbi:MAG TPA: hypothetical protein ENJ28_04880 [Gammaproteobacteria bacterium]|nr:hypothetical protein [Gammaproteobacteria bacterium]